MLKALAGSSWGQETLLMTYNALGKSIANYATPVWSTNASDSSSKKIQTVQNAALRTTTGAHTMASIDHLHQESLTLRVKDHSDMLSVKYLVNCLEEDHGSHGITIQEPRPMKENNASNLSFKKIQTAQNAALRTLKMASITLRYALCAVPCEQSGGGPRLSWHHNSRAKT